MGKIKYYRLFDMQFLTDNVKNAIKSAVSQNSNIQFKEIEITDWGFIQGFRNVGLRLSSGASLPTKEDATKSALNFITTINKTWGNIAQRVFLPNASIPYLFPPGLQHDYTREITENNKPQYWEVNLRLRLNSGLAGQNSCIAYGGGVIIYVGAAGRITGINYTIRTYISSNEVDVFKIINDTGNDIAKDLSVVYLFDFRKSIIAPYFLKVPLNSNRIEGQSLDNFTADKNFNWPARQENWKIDKTNLIPACKESTILEYGKYQCIANRTLTEGDVSYLIKPLLKTQNVTLNMLFGNSKCELARTEQNLNSFTDALNETFAHFGIKSIYQRIHFFSTNRFGNSDVYNSK